MLNHAITPRFSDRDENRPNVVIEAESDHKSHGSWIPVAATETQSVIQLQEVRQSDGFPAPEQTGGDSTVLLGSLRLNVDLVAEEVDDIE